MERTTEGWGSGLLGVVIFSGSLPATRVAVGGFSPLFLTSARAVIAALLGAAFLVLLATGETRTRRYWPPCHRRPGRVVGFPLLISAGASAHHLSAFRSSSSVLLPLATAIFGVLRGGEKPKPVFWLFSVLGSCDGRRLRASQQRRRFARRRSV